MKRATAAFTAIEVLVVTAIIAVLAALLFPVLGAAKTRSLVSVDVAQMRQIYDSIVMYEADSDGMSPASLTSLQPYLHSTAVLASPVDPFRTHIAGFNDFPANPPCPEAPNNPRSSYRISYGYMYSAAVCYGLQEKYPTLRADPKWCLLTNWLYNDPYETQSITSDIDLLRWQKLEYRIRNDGSLSTWRFVSDASIGCSAFEQCFAPDGTNINQ